MGNASDLIIKDPLMYFGMKIQALENKPLIIL